MTEQEYIAATDLAKIRHATKILREIVPENSTIIKPELYREIIKQLKRWEIHFERTINIEEAEDV